MSYDLTNPKLLKEWDKIKDSDVFPSLDAFAELFYQNPSCKCYRKYTSYPWSKENFFFGTYEEFLTYQRTTTEIPFYLASKIGTKVFNLTLLSFFRDENNKICAKCRCDCGNETIKPFDGIAKGNIRSCGCLSRRIISEPKSIKQTHPEILAHWDYEKNTILDTSVTSQSTKIVWWKCVQCNTSFEQSVSSFLRKKHCPTCDEKSRESVWRIYPELVEDEWDYEKNEIDPKDFLVSSSKLVWWKPRYGHSFQATVAERMRSPQGTSFEEQAIYYYVKQLFKDAINRGKYAFDDSGEIEIDIYIPCLHFAIEYDGAFWHKNKIDRDYHKNSVLKNAGAHLLRVRESGLADLEDNFGEVIYRKTSSGDTGLHLQEVINEVIRSIKTYITVNQFNLTNDIQLSLDAFKLTKEKLIEDRPNIYAQYITAYQKDNITKTCLMKFWDFEKNGNLLPQNVSIKAGIFVVLTCPKGHSFHVPPSRYKLSVDQSSQCKHCILNHCPAIFEYADCDARNCDIYNSLLETSNYVPINEGNRHSRFVEREEISIESSPCTKMLVKSSHLLYKKMQKSIADRLEKSPEKISSKTLLKWLISLDIYDRFDFLKAVDAVGQNTSPSLIDKMKDVLHNKVSLNNTYFTTTIGVPDTISADVALGFFKTYGSKSFSFSSLKYFDAPVIMDDFCDLLLSECRRNDFVCMVINHFDLAGKIEREYECLSNEFLVRLYKLLTRLNQIQFISEFDKCKKLLYSKISTDLSVAEDKSAKSVISIIQNCGSATKAQVRSWIDETLSPQKEQIIYLLYQKGFLKLIGSKASDSAGCKFSSKELNIDFIGDVETQLNIMAILGIHRFKYSLKLFDNPKFSDRFVSLIKKSADTSDEFLISGYDSDQLKAEILANVDTLSYAFAKQLYSMLMYLSTTVDRPYPCWYDDDPKEAMSALKRKITGKEPHYIAKKENLASPLTLGVTITFPDDVRAKHEAEIRELEEIEQHKFGEREPNGGTSGSLQSSADAPKNISHSSKKAKKKSSSNTAATIFNALWTFTKGAFFALWQICQVLVVIATLIFAFLDGLFFHKIRMQGIRKRAAQKAARTRKRNAPYKPSKRSRHYNLK